MSNMLKKIGQGNLMLRILSGSLFGALFLGALWAGGWPLKLWLGLLTIGCLYELGTLMKQDKKRRPNQGKWFFILWAVVIISVFIALAEAIFSPPIFVGFVLAIVWATDVGAYATGRLLGGPKMAPRISPNKTWIGFIGGIVTASLTSVALGKTYLSQEWIHLEWLKGGVSNETIFVIWAIVLSLSAHGGDLAESWIKRHVGVKDSGWILPGHGGLLDRMDSFIGVFAFITFVPFLIFFVVFISILFLLFFIAPILLLYTVFYENFFELPHAFNQFLIQTSLQ